MVRIGPGLGFRKIGSPLKLLTRNSDWAIWADKATGTSKGTNSPQVNPIVDLVGVVGKNLFDANGNRVSGYLANTGSVSVDAGWLTFDFISVKPSTNYKFSGLVSSTAAFVNFYDINKVLIIGITNTAAISACLTPANTAYIRFSTTLITLATLQFELGTVATAYEPYGKANGLLQGFGFIPTSGYVDVVAPNGKTVTGIQADGVNDVIVLPSNAPNPVGLQDFGFAFVFKTGATIPAVAHLICRGNAEVQPSQYNFYLRNDGTNLVVRAEFLGTANYVFGNVVANTWYKLIVKRVSGVLTGSLNSVQTVNVANTSNLVEKPLVRLFARPTSADGLTHGNFFNGILCYADYNNGTDIGAWEADQNKAIAKIYGL